MEEEDRRGWKMRCEQQTMTREVFLVLGNTVTLHLSPFLSTFSTAYTSVFPIFVMSLFPHALLFVYLQYERHNTPITHTNSRFCVSYCAAKLIDRSELAEEDEQSLRNEVAILKLLKHKNIVTCIDFYAEDKTYYLVLEYMEGGELFDRIVKKSFYNEREARDVVFTLLSAIEYCHSHNIVHRYTYIHACIHTK